MELHWRKGPYSWIVTPSGNRQDWPPLFQRSDAPQTPGVRDLCVRLLCMGGTAVVIPFNEEWASQLIADDGKLIAFKDVQMVPGGERECHSNSAILWHKDPLRKTLVTGYALSRDGNWRRHSWLLDEAQQVIETTIPREMYFGVMLSSEQATLFHRQYASRP